MSNIVEIGIKRDETVIDNLVESIYQKYRLPKNQAKGEHQNMKTMKLLELLIKEIEELLDSINKKEYENTFKEAADVSIYSAFLADPERIKNEQEERISELERKIFA